MKDFDDLGSSGSSAVVVQVDPIAARNIGVVPVVRVLCGKNDYWITLSQLIECTYPECSFVANHHLKLSRAVYAVIAQRTSACVSALT